MGRVPLCAVAQDAWGAHDCGALAVHGQFHDLHRALCIDRRRPGELHHVLVAVFDAEEMGLQGSKHFVANPPVALEKIILNINMDMIAHNDKNELYACGTFHFPALKPYIFYNQSDAKILFGHDDPKTGNEDWTYQSDQGSFFAKKIPFIYFGVEDHKDYHKETDEFQNINQKFYTAAVNAILGVIKNIDKNYTTKDVVADSMIMK